MIGLSTSCWSLVLFVEANHQVILEDEDMYTVRYWTIVHPPLNVLGFLQLNRFAA